MINKLYLGNLFKMIVTLLFVYIFMYILLKNHEHRWNVFTRLVSLCNSFQCTAMAIYMVTVYYTDIMDINWVGDDNVINSLRMFSTYLFIDGIFCLPSIISKPNLNGLTSILHHFVGGFGIYLIAKQRMGLGLGVYFAWTEVSTPLLNLSWYYYTNKIKTKFVYGLFYIVFTLSRIVTIPVILGYIYVNRNIIYQLPSLHYWMVHGGSYTLITLNIVWFVMLTRKLNL